MAAFYNFENLRTEEDVKQPHHQSTELAC